MKRPLPLLLALLGALVFAAGAHASTTVDVRGTWGGGAKDASGTYPATIVLTDEDFATGAVVGHGSGNGYTWPEHITLTGSHMESIDGPYDQLPTYSGHGMGTVSADGNTIAGTWTDSSGQSGTFTWQRLSGGGGAPAPAPTPTPQPSPDTFKTVCVSIWIGDCTGFMPAPDPLRVCVSYWEDCNGFGGSKPAKPGTIDMSGFPAELKTPVLCGGSASTRAESDGDGPTCKLVEYMNSDGPRNAADDELEYNLNSQTFATEVDVKKADVVSALTQCAVRFGHLPGMTDKTPPCRPLVGILAGTAAAAGAIFDAAKAPGKPVDTSPPAFSAAGCDQLGGDEISNDLRTLCQDMIRSANEVTTGYLAKLAALKRQLGVDVPFKAKSKGGARAAAATSAKRFTGPTVIGYARLSVAPGKHGTLRMKVPKRVRAWLRTLKRRGVRHVRATVHLDYGAVAGLRYTKTLHVTLALHKPRKAGHR